MPRALIGATMNQYGPRDRVLRNLLLKLQAGADFVQTQPVFDLELFASFAKEAVEAAPATRIMSLLMPLRSSAEARCLQKRLNMALPDRTLERLDLWGEGAGWEIFEETLEALSRSGLAHALAVMTMLAEPPEPIAARVAGALREHT